MKTLINLSFSILISINDDAVLHYAQQKNISFSKAFKHLAKLTVMHEISKKLE